MCYSNPVFELLKVRDEERLAQREVLRRKVLNELRASLTEIAPGEPVFVFGSLLKPHGFHAMSDVDVAFEAEPRRWSLYGTQAELEERLHRRVDVMLLSETRLREKIEREGERWMP